ncbi:MAG: hypothetical protein H6708_19180 [Kofleriaceae bacterium]|nr:hypothetical protein [Kofleriaceae bacterium]
MSPVVLSVVAAVVAVAAALVAWLPWFVRAINHVVFYQVCMKLIAAGNLDRLRKLCNAAPRSPIAQAVELATVEVQKLDGEIGAAATVAVAETFRSTIRVGLQTAMRPWAWAVAIGAAGVCVYAVVVDGAPTVALAGPAVALVIAAHVRQIAQSLARGGAAGLEQIVPALLATRAAR